MAKAVLIILVSTSFIKTFRKDRLHIYVLFFTPGPSTRLSPGTCAAARTDSGFLLQNHPQDVTIGLGSYCRKGKNFLDYNQNVRGKTLASVYSPRPNTLATFRTPHTLGRVGKVYPTELH